MITIDLPYPHKALWPNGRAHWGTKSTQTQKHRQWAHLATLAETNASFVPSAIKLIVHAKPKGPLPDRDNCIAACKALLDGVADALGVNDQDFPALTVEFASPREGRFVLVLSPTLSDFTHENSASYASDVLQNESGRQSATNTQTALTNNAIRSSYRGS